jgi:hypothetical protein
MASRATYSVATTNPPNVGVDPMLMSSPASFSPCHGRTPLPRSPTRRPDLPQWGMIPLIGLTFCYASSESLPYRWQDRSNERRILSIGLVFCYASSPAYSTKCQISLMGGGSHRLAFSCTHECRHQRRGSVGGMRRLGFFLGGTILLYVCQIIDNV